MRAIGDVVKGTQQLRPEIVDDQVMSARYGVPENTASAQELNAITEESVDRLTGPSGFPPFWHGTLQFAITISVIIWVIYLIGLGILELFK